MDVAAVGGAGIIAWATNVLTLIETLRGAQSRTAAVLRDYVDMAITANIYEYTYFDDVVRGIATGLANDIEKGILPDLPMRIRSDVEADLLSQARRLLDDEDLKDPAAMLAGAVLEDALRQLCRKHEVTEARNIEGMNEPLRRAGVYGLAARQQVTAWAAIRNDADHAHFDAYDDRQVRLMIQGVNDFIAKHLG
jgi:hypothetical protein